MRAHRVKETLPDVRARHERELAAIVRTTLEATGWRVLETARLLHCAPNAVYRIAERDPGLSSDLDRYGHGAGRAPKKTIVDAKKS